MTTTSAFPYRLGRHPTPHAVLQRQLRLRAYLRDLPAGPAAVNYTAGIASWPMDLNDQLGDCLIAGQAHMTEVFTAEVDGSPRIVSDADILKAYEGLGYVPGDPSTDQGGTCVQALTQWRDVGLAGDKILGWAAVSANQADLQAACWLFSGLYCGFDVPASALDQFQAGKAWDVVSDDGGIVGGHCVPILGYDAHGVTVVTWGQLQRATWAFVATYFSEQYAVIPSDYQRLSSRALPCGLALDALIADMDSIGGNAPPAPAPTPSPAPPPFPIPPPAVIAWLQRVAHRLPEPERSWAFAVIAWAEAQGVSGQHNVPHAHLSEDMPGC